MEANKQKVQKVQKQKTAKVRGKGANAFIIILGCAAVAFTFFYWYCALPFHFNEKGMPADDFGTLYKGGWVIPCVITLLLTVISLSIERAFALNRCSGKGSATKFVIDAKKKLEDGDIEGAVKLCDTQKGSVANILRAGLIRYKDVEQIEGLNNAGKADMITAEIEEATTLELPYLEKNMNIIAAISTLGTLFGLFGTVLGMIRSFGAMGADGGVIDSTAIAVGISEALLNTALGIATGALAIISYTYFSGRIQDMTNAVDEIGFAIGQTYTEKHGGLTK